MKKHNKTISLVLPAFNEAERIGSSLKEIFRFIESDGFDAEVLVIDDGSADSTSKVAIEVCEEYPHIVSRVISYEKNQGKGFAVTLGLQEANGEIAVFSDADLSTPIEEVYKVISPILKGKSDIVIGSRALNRALIGKRQSWKREQSGKVFNLIVQIIAGLSFRDTQCGFKAFRMEVFHPLLALMQIRKFGFDVEYLFVAKKKGLRLMEVPVRWNHADGSTVNMARDSVRMFVEMVQIRWNDLNGKYNRQYLASRRELENALMSSVES